MVLYKITDLIIPLRVSEEQEAVGLDLSQHGEMAVSDDLFNSRAESGGAHRHEEVFTTNPM